MSIQTLLLENEKLKNEVERLKFDNGQLLLKCKHAEEYKSDIVVSRKKQTYKIA